jgi:hypothetical protein
MTSGDQVEWTNGSYLVETQGAGEVVHVSGDHAVIFNAEIARRHPHMSPYVSKRTNELRLIRRALAA